MGERKETEEKKGKGDIFTKRKPNSSLLDIAGILCLVALLPYYLELYASAPVRSA